MMALNRTHLRALAGLLIGVLLLAQMAVAAYVCPATSAALVSVAGVSASAPAVWAPASGPQARADMPDCAGMASQDVDSNNPNVCAEHCRYGQQGDQASSLTVPSAVLMALYAVTPQTPLPMSTRGVRASTLSALVAASPPHTVLHCCYRI